MMVDAGLHMMLKVVMMWLLMAVVAGGIQSDEERLLHWLFDGYNPAARPVIRSNKTANVSIQFSLMHIQQLDVRSQILTATGLLILEWTDERLVWSEEQYNLGEIVVEARKLWVPEFAIINGADEIYGDYREFRAIVTSEGLIRWEPGGVFKTMCEIDITYFPFDEQTCALVFGAWSYHTTKMNLTNSADSINLDSYEHNGEWEIMGTKVQRDEFFYECCPDQRFSNVAFRLKMRRRYTFYVMNVILPSMVTSILLLSIFYCPPGQKVQIGVVVLLSFRIFLLNVTDSIPKTSDHIPLLGIYLTCTMAITTLSMVLTVMVLNLHSISERPVPYWAKVLIIRYMGRLFCLGAKEDKGDPMQKEFQNHIKMKRLSRVSSTQHVVPSENDGDEHIPIIEQEVGFKTRRKSLAARAFTLNGNPVGGGQSGGLDPTFARNNHHTVYAKPFPERQAAEDSDTPPDYSKDWHALAEVVDRLFFWTFFLAIIAISILLFHPLTKDFILYQKEGT